MAATEGKHFADTASANVGSSLGAMTVVSPVEGSVTTVEAPELRTVRDHRAHNAPDAEGEHAGHERAGEGDEEGLAAVALGSRMLGMHRHGLGLVGLLAVRPGRRNAARSRKSAGLHSRRTAERHSPLPGLPGRYKLADHRKAGCPGHCRAQAGSAAAAQAAARQGSGLPRRNRPEGTGVVLESVMEGSFE